MMYEKIKFFLDEMDKSFYWLAKETGITEQTFSMMKRRGSSLSAGNLVKVARALEIPMEKLID